VHSARRRRSVSSTSNDSVSGCISTPNPASSLLHNGTNPQIDIVNDENTSNDDGNDANVPVSNEGNASNKEWRHNHDVHPASRQSPSCQHRSKELHIADNNRNREIDEDGVGADNGNRAGAAAAIRQPELNNSHPPEERMTEGGFPRDAVEDHADSESEWPRAKSKGQQQPSSTATWIPAQPAKQRGSRLTDRKSHPKSVLERSRRRSDLLHFMPNVDFSPLLSLHDPQSRM